MAEFTSQYKALGFYVNGEFHRFNDGRYATDDASTIEVLTSITDAIRIDAVAPKATKQTEAKPATKATARKPSAK